MSGAMTQRDLDKIHGDEPNATIIFMRQQCHPKANLEVAYHKALGIMVCTCASCGAEVGRVAVASTRLLTA